MESKPKTPKCDTHHDCCSGAPNSSLIQTLEEMDFERGIWYAAQMGDEARVKHFLSVKMVSPDVQDLSGYTPLHYASRNGHVRICKLLLSAGANVNITTRAGQASPLQRAANAGHIGVIKLLLGKESGFPCKTDVTAKDADGNNALHKAVQGGHEYAVVLLMEAWPELATICNNKGLLPKGIASTESMVKLFEK